MSKQTAVCDHSSGNADVRYRWYLVWLWSVYLGQLLAAYFIGCWLFARRSQSPNSQAVLAVVCGWAVVVVVVAYFVIVAQRRIEGRIRQFIEKRCVHCGYDLRGSQVRCPECGNIWVQAEAHVVPFLRVRPRRFQRCVVVAAVSALSMLLVVDASCIPKIWATFTRVNEMLH